eukprot:13205309-Ditylum_brightwellii.AAC.1
MSRADLDIWLRKSDNYDGYHYTATHVDDIIVVAKDPSKYMDTIQQHFFVWDVTDSPEYYFRNDLVKHKNKIYVSTKNYVKGVMR